MLASLMPLALKDGAFTNLVVNARSALDGHALFDDVEHVAY